MLQNIILILLMCWMCISRPVSVLYLFKLSRQFTRLHFRNTNWSRLVVRPCSVRISLVHVPPSLLCTKSVRPPPSQHPSFQAPHQWTLFHEGRHRHHLTPFDCLLNCCWCSMSGRHFYCSCWKARVKVDYISKGGRPVVGGHLERSDI